jgi:lysyl-tRNA synthetase class 2
MDSPPRVLARAIVRVLVVALAIILVTSMAIGWLYWLRADVAGWPGPRVADALPLDELPGHDSVPLVVYVSAFGIAATLLGLLARVLRLDRLTAGLSLAAGTGLWLLLVDAFCLFVVRQVPAGQAVRAAEGLQAVYIPAALAGAGGALLGGRVRPGGMTPRMLGLLAAAGGLTDLVSALVPHSGLPSGMLAGIAPYIVSPAAHVLLVPAGVLLLITSRALIRRSRRAWVLAVSLLGLSVLLHLLRGPHYTAATLTGLVLVVLLARREDFPFRGDPAARPSALLRVFGALAFALCYGTAALWTYRTAAGLPFNISLALLDTLRAMGGRLPRDVDLLPVEFAAWFPLSLLSIVAIGLIWAATIWLRPWRQRLLPDPQQREQAARIVRRWGADTLAPFVLRSDKEWFFTGQTLLAYRVIRGVALVSGDPVGPPEQAGQALDSFLAHVQARGWRIAVMGASARLLDTYRTRGLHPLYHGDEAIIDVTAFSLEGRRMRTVRQAANRLARKGFTSEIVMTGDASAALRAELAEVEHTWLRGRARKGFTMELDSLFRLDTDDALFVIGRDDQGQVSGFLHLAVCGPSQSLSLSAMPRRRDTPNGLTAWLITEAVAWARGHGFTHLSLNFSPFAGLLATRGELGSVQRMQRQAVLRLKRVLALQLDNLLRFNGQFSPAWRPRYVVLQAWADLPRVAVAAMAAEGYLPGAGLIRGHGWSPPVAARSLHIHVNRSGCRPTAEPSAEPAGTGRLDIPNSQPVVLEPPSDSGDHAPPPEAVSGQAQQIR